MISILYIDDLEDLLEIGKLFLEREGNIKVDIASSVDEAIEIIEENQYDLILSDYEMPKKTGIDLLIYLRNQGNDIPFIIFTGKGREEIVIQALNCGADYYIQKGGNQTALFAEVRHKIQLAVERKDNINALKRSEERLNYILDLLPEATFVTNLQGEVLLWNKAMEEMTGCPATQVLGKGDFAYSIPFYKKKHPMLIDNILTPNNPGREKYIAFNQQGQVLTAEIEIASENSSSRFIWGIASPLINNEGTVTGAIEMIRDITEKKVAESNLAMLASIVEYSDDAITMISLDGIISSWNNGAEKLYGYDSFEAIGRNFSFLLSPTHPLDYSLILEKIQTGEIVHQLESIQRKDKNHELSISLLFSPIRDINRKITGISVIGRDVSELKIVEASLRESEKQFRDLFELNVANMLIIDPDTGEILHANSAASSYYGYSIEELSSINMTGINIGDPELIRAKMQKAKIKQDTRFSFQHRMKNGEIRDVEVFSAPIAKRDSIVLHSIIHDVTDKKKLERALFESEQQYRSVVEDQIELICRFLPDGTNTFVNNAYCRYFNKERAEIIGTRFSPNFIEVDENLIRNYYKSLSENGNIGTIERRIVKPDGKIRWLQCNDRRIVDEFGKTLEYQSVALDITEKKQAEEQLILKNIELQVAYEQIAATEEELRQNIEEISMREQELQIANEQLKVTEEELKQQYDDIVQVERKLRENEDNFQMMIESAPDAIYIADEEVFLYVNPVMVRVLGADSADDLIGKSVFSRISPGYHNICRDRALSVLRQQKPVEKKEIVYLKLDNTPIYVETSVSCIKFKNRAANLIFLRVISEKDTGSGIIHDKEKTQINFDSFLTGFGITNTPGCISNANCDHQDSFNADICLNNCQFYHTLQSFQTYEIIYHLIFENSGVIMVLLDENSTILCVNSKFESISGYRRNEVEGKRRLADFLKIEIDGNIIDLDLIRPFHQELKSDCIECRFITHSGEIRNMILSSFYISSSHKWIALLTDITEKVEEWDRLKLTTEKNELLHKITHHDIANKLTGLMGYIECAKKEENLFKIKDYLRMIDERRKAILNDIDFSYNYLNFKKEESEWHNVSQLVDQVLKKVPISHIQVIHDFEGVEIFADPLLGNVFYNLIENSLHHGKHVTVIRLGYEIHEDIMHLIFEDDGLGIHPSEKEKIFCYGYGKHNGFGLSLIRDILSLTKISIRENGISGKGARFEIIIPQGSWNIN